MENSFEKSPFIDVALTYVVVERHQIRNQARELALPCGCQGAHGLTTGAHVGASKRVDPHAKHQSSFAFDGMSLQHVRMRLRRTHGFANQRAFSDPSFSRHDHTAADSTACCIESNAELCEVSSASDQLCSRANQRIGRPRGNMP